MGVVACGVEGCGWKYVGVGGPPEKERGMRLSEKRNRWKEIGIGGSQGGDRQRWKGDQVWEGGKILQTVFDTN